MDSPAFTTFDPDDADASIRGRAVQATATGDGITLEAEFYISPRGHVMGFLCGVPEGLGADEFDAIMELRRRALEGTWTPAALVRIIPQETYAHALARDAQAGWESAS